MPANQETQEIREWAEAAGHKVPTRGRMPKNIRKLYAEAHGMEFTENTSNGTSPFRPVVLDREKLMESFRWVPKEDLPQVGAKERDEIQLLFDSMVRDAYEAWKDDGEPRSLKNRSVWASLTVDVSEVDTVQSGIRKAGTFLGYRVRVPKARVAEGIDGGRVVDFAATDPLDKGEADADESDDNSPSDAAPLGEHEPAEF